MHGELIDTYKEFFVGINQDVATNGGSLWHDLYFIRTAMLPNFFSKDLAQQILVIGKSINFLRACIHSGAWDKENVSSGKAEKSFESKVQPDPIDTGLTALSAQESSLDREGKATIFLRK